MKSHLLMKLMPTIGLSLALGALPLRAVEASPKQATYLGVSVSQVEAALRSQLHLRPGQGLLVREVEAKSPAETAGVKSYDVLEKLDDQILFNAEQLASLVRSFKPGDSVSLSLIREGQPRKLEATLGEHTVTQRPGPQADRLVGPGWVWRNPEPFRAFEFNPYQFKSYEFKPFEGLPKTWTPEKGEVYLGVEAKPVEPSLAAQLNLEDGVGALVAQVLNESPAARAGLKPNDVLVKVDGKVVKGSEGLVKLIRDHQDGDQVQLSLRRGGKPMELSATLARKSPPKPAQWRQLLRDYRVVPHIRVLPDPQRADGRIVVLQPAAPPDRATIQIAPEAAPPQPGHSSGQSDRTTDPGTAPAHTTRMIRIKSEGGSITIQLKEGRQSAVVKDAAEKTIFEGPIDTPAQRAKLPANIRQRIEKAENRMELHVAPPSGGEKLKVLEAHPQPSYIRSPAPDPVQPGAWM